MSALSVLPCLQENHHPHEEFLALRPIIERHVRVVFRARNQAEYEEAVAEAVASAFESYLSLKRRGKDPIRDFPSMMATFAVLHVKNGRHVGGHSNSKDVLSLIARRKHGFQVERLPQSFRTRFEDRCNEVGGQVKQDSFEEILWANSHTAVPDQVCFRLDWPVFLRTLSGRERRMIHYLSLGHSAKATAHKFRISPGRVTQLRQRWHREWLNFQGDNSHP